MEKFIELIIYWKAVSSSSRMITIMFLKYNYKLYFLSLIFFVFYYLIFYLDNLLSFMNRHLVFFVSQFLSMISFFFVFRHEFMAMVYVTE